MDSALKNLVISKIKTEIKGYAFKVGIDIDSDKVDKVLEDHKGYIVFFSKLLKEKLSSEDTANADFPFSLLKPAYLETNKNIDKFSEKLISHKLTITITRKEFDMVISEILQLIRILVYDTVKSWANKVRYREKLLIDEIVLVGGCSYIPSVREAVRKACGDLGR